VDEKERRGEERRGEERRGEERRGEERRGEERRGEERRGRAKLLTLAHSFKRIVRIPNIFHFWSPVISFFAHARALVYTCVDTYTILDTSTTFDGVGARVGIWREEGKVVVWLSPLLPPPLLPHLPSSLPLFLPPSSSSLPFPPSLLLFRLYSPLPLLPPLFPPLSPFLPLLPTYHHKHHGKDFHESEYLPFLEFPNTRAEKIRSREW
jgi:hypothetical protein